MQHKRKTARMGMDSCLRRNDEPKVGRTERGWIPAFAGMTALGVSKFTPPHPPPANFLNLPTRHCR